MKTLIAFVLALATPALSYITLSHDYTLEAIVTGKVPATAKNKNIHQRLTAIEDTREKAIQPPDSGKLI